MLLNLNQVKQVLRPNITATAVPNKRLAHLFNDQRIFNEIEEVLPDGASAWPITAELGRFLARAVVKLKCRNVLEFGAGSSSLVLARALSLAGGGQLTSIEQDPEWCTDIFDEVKKVKNVDACLVNSKLSFKATRQGFYHSYDKAAQIVAERGPYDLVLIDGPQTFYGRDGGLHLAYQHLALNALIILDDAKRKGEQFTIQRWLRTYPGLHVTKFDPAFSDRGVAVLVNNRHPEPNVSLNSLLTSGGFALKNWYYRRQLNLAT